ncbi:MAG: hypothetical protein ABEK42_11745 [Thiohalorhabdaceae bacterium]
MQIRYEIPLTGKEYVSQQAWRDASLPFCPFHPQGGCGFARHGTYPRESPPGCRVPRWYCPTAGRTFSLLPDCLPAHLPGTFEEMEQVVVAVEQAPSHVAAADSLRPDIELPGALRWLDRRVKAFHRLLHRLKGLVPERLAGVPPTVAGFRQVLAVDGLWPVLRAIAASFLHSLPPPLGFGPRLGAGGGAAKPFQQSMGPDPPFPLA